MTTPHPQPAGVFARRGRNVEPETYDFRRPMTLAREHARHLEMAFQRVGRQMGTQLTARLRVVSAVTFDDLVLQTYEDYVTSVPAPTAMVLCTLEQSRQTAVLQLPVGAALVWVDYLFGGDGRGDAREGREITDLEWTLVSDLLQHGLGDLEYAFAGVAPMKTTVRSVQYNPQFVQAAAATDMVLVAAFTLRIGEREEHMTFMVPADALLGPLRKSDGADARTPEERRLAALAHDELERTVQDVPVEVAVRFAPVTVHPRDVVHLAVGDVLPLSHPSSTPLDVVIDGIVLARAAAGSNGARLAAQVVTVEEIPA